MDIGPDDSVSPCRHNQPCFDELVERHGPGIQRLARRLAPPGIDPDDVAQETLLRAYRGLHTFRGDCSIRTWLYRIAVNVAQSQRDRSLRDPLAWSRYVSTHEDSQSGVGLVADNDVERSIVLRRTIGQALAALPLAARQVIVLRHFDELAYEEIAALTGTPLGTIESRLFRARRKLRPLLEPL
jgi:RNA polymerase sigma-70 factor, ECF subfamily